MSCVKCKRTAKATALGGIERLPSGELMHRQTEGCFGALMEHVAVIEEENRILLEGNQSLSRQVKKLEDFYPVSADGQE